MASGAESTRALYLSSLSRRASSGLPAFGDVMGIDVYILFSRGADGEEPGYPAPHVGDLGLVFSFTAAGVFSDCQEDNRYGFALRPTQHTEPFPGRFIRVEEGTVAGYPHHGVGVLPEELGQLPHRILGQHPFGDGAAAAPGRDEFPLAPRVFLPTTDGLEDLLDSRTFD